MQLWFLVVPIPLFYNITRCGAAGYWLCPCFNGYWTTAGIKWKIQAFRAKYETSTHSYSEEKPCRVCWLSVFLWIAFDLAELHSENPNVQKRTVIPSIKHNRIQLGDLEFMGTAGMREEEHWTTATSGFERPTQNKSRDPPIPPRSLCSKRENTHTQKHSITVANTPFSAHHLQFCGVHFGADHAWLDSWIVQISTLKSGSSIGPNSKESLLSRASINFLWIPRDISFP